MQTRGWTTLVVAAMLSVAACSGSSSESVEPDEVAASVPPSEATDSPPVTEVDSEPDPESVPEVTEPEATEVETIEEEAIEEEAIEEEAIEEEAIEEEAIEWTRVVPDSPDCACSDGSEFSFFERPGDPSKVMFYFEGGGACFNLATCDPDGDPTYTIDIDQTTDGLAERGGLFDAANPENPLGEHSIVYVPYCTGDVHLGNATTEYSQDVVIEHRGAANAQAALAHLVENYPDVEQVLVAGASAGSVPTPLVAGLVADELPAAQIITLGDSSGAYPDVPAVNELIGNLWGTTNAIPEWPENEGLTAAEWSFPGLYIQASQHAPNITFARFDYAFDEVQATFAALAGVDSDAVVEQIDATEEQVEAAGTPLAVYVAPGTEHTIIGGDEVYAMEVGGVRLIDWITELVDGAVPADVHCVDCQT